MLALFADPQVFFLESICWNLYFKSQLVNNVSLDEERINRHRLPHLFLAG